jgi:excisionase family DNA binding protein
MEPLLLTPDQAAEVLQISKSYLYELKSRNLIPYVKIGAMTTSTNYITVRRAAELAGVSHWAIRKWIKRGRLLVKQPGGNRGYLLIDKSSLINILEGNNG